VLNGTELDWQKGEHPTQQAYWEAFASWKKSEEALAISKVNTLNSHRNDNPHRNGSWGYLLARKMTYNDDGSLSFPNDTVWQLAERIQAL